ncbi:Gamma-glutamylcyclotransferase [uncultured Gammaproteobacteria bacterium]
MGRKTTKVTIWSLIFTVMVAFGLPVQAADYWGSSLSNRPIQFIFGYGSLINTLSRNRTAGKTTAAIPVRISAEFGYLRAWVARAPTGFTALGLRKPQVGEKPDTINGVLYPVDGTDMAPFDQRENGYTRIAIPLALIEAVSWQPMPRDNVLVWVYVPVGSDGKPGENLMPPSAAFPLLESYIDVVIDGTLEFGPEFARELIETTQDWSQYWLNDRELARRPWIYNKNYSEEDELLSTTPSSAKHFKDRLFSEEFTAQHLSPRPH